MSLKYFEEKTMSHRIPERGISVLEVSIIVLVVGVLAAILVPNIVQSRQSYNIKIAADALAQQLNRCRQEAVRANLPLKIKVTTAGTAIDLDRDGTYDTASANNEGTYTTISNDATITLVDPTDGIVEYSSRGEMPIATTTPEFQVVYGSKMRRVTIDPRGAVNVSAEEEVTS